MLKKTAKYIYASFLYHVKLTERIKYLKERKSVLAIYDHDPSPEDFEKYIRWLLHKGFEFISLEELLHYLDGETALSSSKIWFTLDDGWRGNLELLSVIEKYQVPVTLFIPTHAVETGFYRDTLEQVFSEKLPEAYKGDLRKLHDIPNAERTKTDAPLFEKAKDKLPREAITVEELKMLSEHQMISIGLHTHTHPVLTQCSGEEIKTELEINREKLREYTGTAPVVLALPYGRYNEKVLQTVHENNTAYVAASDSGLIDQTNVTNALPRNGIAKASFYENCCRMLDFWYPNVAKLNSVIRF